MLFNSKRNPFSRKLALLNKSGVLLNSLIHTEESLRPLAGEGGQRPDEGAEVLL